MFSTALLPQRSLGDDLYFLAQLSKEDIEMIHTLVKYRIRVRVQEEYDRIIAASKGLKLVPKPSR